MKRRANTNIPVNVIIPNMITCGSIFCGTASLVMTLHGRFIPSALLIFFATFFDFMDGRVARKLDGTSAFGEQLDSLADALSFGAAPAFLVYGAYLNNAVDALGIAATAFFTLCGILRLARFNVCHVAEGPFQGLPIPAGGLTLASLVLSRYQISPIIVMFCMFSVGALMVSSISYCNAKKLNRQNMNKIRLYFIVACVVACLYFLRLKAFIYLSGFYIITGLLGIDLSKWVRNDK